MSLFRLGEMATATESLDEATFRVLGAELGYKIQVVSPEDEDRELLECFGLDRGRARGRRGRPRHRPPVVTVMGHVDHGRPAARRDPRDQVVAREAGGITQHIGAYQVDARARGHRPRDHLHRHAGSRGVHGHACPWCRVTDIAILVVAADDGVMPQTVEALNHAQAADVPIVVAVNKIDKPGADPAKAREQLTEYGLVAEEYGGDAMFVDVSALASIGIEELLEAVLLTAEPGSTDREPNKDARGTAIEAGSTTGREPVATVLIQRGTLRVGDSIVCGHRLRPCPCHARRERRPDRLRRARRVRRRCSA